MRDKLTESGFEVTENRHGDTLARVDKQVPGLRDIIAAERE